MTELFSFFAEMLFARGINLVGITGGGGKTSFMYGVGRTCGKSHRVLLTTTTKIKRPLSTECRNLFIGSAQDCAAQLRAMPGASVLTAAACERNGKLIGYLPEEAEKLSLCGAVDIVVAECDGSRGRSVKFYEPWEPPVPRASGCVFAVAGVDVLGMSAEEDYVFRAEKFRQLFGLSEGSVVSSEVFLSYLRHKNGPLRNAPEGALHVLLLNKFECADEKTRRDLLAMRQALLETYDAVAFVSMRSGILYEYAAR